MTQLELFDDTVSLANEISEIKTKILEYQTKLRLKEQELKETCEHPEDMVKDEYFFCDGSYYDMGFTEKWRRCTICGTESKRIRESTGSYG